MQFILKLFLIFLILFNHQVFGYICSNSSSAIHYNFYPIKHCQRSNKTVIGLYNVKTSNECANAARLNKAMAFNYAPENRGTVNGYALKKEENKTFYTFYSKKTILEEPEEFFNCELLECPEFSNFSQMINDSRFDYYSLYTDPPPPVNSTCLPSVGIFQYHHKFYNYNNATLACQQSGGVLAHILSEIRTESISAFLRKELNHTILELAYVGLNETKTADQFITSTGEPLRCFKYRAWAPKHPNPKWKIFGCVALTKERSWKMYNCEKKLPFVCELFTTKPNKTINVSRKCPAKLK